jgi:hypothetical protein
MTLKAKIFLAVAGVLLMGLSFVFLTGWLKYLVMFAGSIAVNAVWHQHAGTSEPEEEEPRIVWYHPSDTTDPHDPTQNIFGLNGNNWDYDQ